MVRPKSKRAKIEIAVLGELGEKGSPSLPNISNSFASLPTDVLQLTFSFLSIEELPNVGRVCQKFAKVAKYDLEKRLIPLRKNDWRLEYIQKKKFGIEVSPFIVSNVLEKAKQKDKALAERQILTKPHYEMDTENSDYDIQMTENILAYTGGKNKLGSNGKKTDKHFLTVERRVDGATFDICLGRDDQFLLWNWSIVILINGHDLSAKGSNAFKLTQPQLPSHLRYSGERFRTRYRTPKFAYWTIPEIGRKKKKKMYTIVPTNLLLELENYCVNGNYILLRYTTFADSFSGSITTKEELWRMADPAPMHIALPNVELFCSQNESIDEMINGGGWMFDTNTNSQFLVKACKAEMETEDENMATDEYFVLVFKGFDAPKFLHRINTTPYRCFDLHLTVVGENLNAKTLLMVERVSFQSFWQPEIETEEGFGNFSDEEHPIIRIQIRNPYGPEECDRRLNEFGEELEMSAFDLASGQRLFTRPYGKHTSFVPSRRTVWFDLFERDCVAKLLWINWNGTDLAISESNVPLPVNRMKTTIRAVTETRILWDVAGENANYYISYDYLLPDLGRSLINSDKKTWLKEFYKEDGTEDTDTNNEDA